MNNTTIAGTLFDPQVSNSSSPNRERNALDVFTTQDAAAGKPVVAKPVVVFVHGGGFARGAKRTEGLPFYDTPTEPARIDQDGCRYIPHVFGMRAGQPLEILNSDPTLHNIHATPKHRIVDPIAIRRASVEGKFRA